MTTGYKPCISRRFYFFGEEIFTIAIRLVGHYGGNSDIYGLTVTFTCVDRNPVTLRYDLYYTASY
jgi:hypothetical protein